jgi:hypothetical protein
MRARRVVSLVLAGILMAGGCGGDDDDDNDTARQPLGGGLALKLYVEPEKPRTGEPVTWTLEVINAGVEAVTLTFASAQRGDIVLREEGKKSPTYRWSADRFFAEVIKEERLRPNDEKRYSLDEKALDVPAGKYELEATLKASPTPDPVRRDIKIEAGPKATTTTR